MNSLNGKSGGGQNKAKALRVQSVVNKITGKKVLGSEDFKPIIELCKNDAENIQRVADALLERLECEHSQIRLNVLDVVEDLFERSHQFRTALCNQLQRFLELTAETDPLDYPLPPPKSSAKTLKTRSVALVQKWTEKYASAYAKLTLAEDFLRKTVKPELAETGISAETRENGRQQREVLAQQRIQSEFEEKKTDMEQTLNSMKTCFDLLFPEFSDMHDSSGIAGQIQHDQPAELAETGSESTFLATHGFPTKYASFEISIDLTNPVKQSCDNQPIIEQLIDSDKLINNSYLPYVEKCLKSLGSAPSGGRLLSEVLDLKSRLKFASQKFSELRLKAPSRFALETEFSDSDDDGDDFIDVPEVNIEDMFPGDDISDPDEPGPSHRKCRKPAHLFTSPLGKQILGYGDGPRVGAETSEEGTISQVKIKEVPFGLDLKYWGQDKIEAAELPVNNADCHRFWQPNSDIACSSGAKPEEPYRSRVMTFAGERRQIDHQCRAPLANGKLCTRKDQYRCPIHGVIVLRDVCGNPVSLEGTGPGEARVAEGTPDIPAWQDPQLLAEIKAATGRDLAVTSGRKRHRSGSGDETIRVSDSTAPRGARARLAKKLFKSRTMAKVSKSVTSEQSAKHDAKYAAFWQYSMRS